MFDLHMSISTFGMSFMCFFFLSQAGKLIANLIVMGSTIIGRAMLQAYRKALDSKFCYHELLHDPYIVSASPLLLL